MDMRVTSQENTTNTLKVNILNTTLKTEMNTEIGQSQILSNNWVETAG